MNYEINDKELAKIGIAKRKKIINFIRLCKKFGVDHTIYNLSNIGAHRIQRLKKEIFGEENVRSGRKDAGYSPSEKGKETRKLTMEARYGNRKAHLKTTRF